jgi:hypothetical protein
MRVTSDIPFGRPLFLPVHVVNSVQTLKATATQAATLTLTLTLTITLTINSVQTLKALSRTALHATPPSACPSKRAMHEVRVFGQKFTLEDAIGSHACSLEALACV